MSYTSSEPTVERVEQRLPDVSCDLLVVPVFRDDPLDDLGELDRASDSEIGRARSTGEFQGKADELFVTRLGHAGWRAARVALVGAGTRGEDVPGALRRVAATALRDARRRRASTLAFLLRDGMADEAAARAVTEGLVLGSFDDRRFKTEHDEATPPVTRCLLVLASPASQTEAGPTLDEAITSGRVVAEATNRARELVNAPGNALTPRVFATRAEELVGSTGVTVDILDEAAIQKLGMGLLMGVAQGSAEPPRLIVMRHEPPDAPDTPVLALVGKGITFDTGGISLKPADKMEEMKGDMAGGAAVIGAMRALGTLGAPRRIIGIVATTENMPGGRAIKPGDVLTAASGTTVEVINTDAEGRLILGDALWYARQLGATHLVDIATLTGACVVALGHEASGLFGRPSGWTQAVQAAAVAGGERVWPLPLYDEYREEMRSATADLMNSAGRAGGACTAAAFLSAFVAECDWAHLDIAGTAWAEKATASQAKGATGAMVRTLTALARSPQNW